MASPRGHALVQNPVVRDADRTRWVVEQAQALGFDLCGVAPAEDFDELRLLPEWLGRGYAGEMAYLSDARRNSPAQVLHGARSVIVCALNYNTALPYSTEVPANTSLAGGQGFSPDIFASNPKGASAPQAGEGPRGWISRYAWGDDYHQVMESKLEALLASLREHLREPFEARVYVDTGPVVERVAAKYAGLGWLAKNTCLIHPQLGSWLFLGVILTTLELATSLGAGQAPLPDLCGNCRLCLEACPTGAIVEPYVLDARRCISYLTIELRGSIPVELREHMGRMVFGCDICQDVCPWNRNAPATSLAQFSPRRVKFDPESRKTKLKTLHGSRENLSGGQRFSPDARAREQKGAWAPDANEAGLADARSHSLFAPELEWLASLSEEEFREVFRSSAVKRTKWRGLVRNACVALGNSGVRPGTAAYARSVALLERLASSGDALIAEHARWALARLRSP